MVDDYGRIMIVDKLCHIVPFVCHYIFVAFVEDNTTMSSVRYFEKHASYFVHTHFSTTNKSFGSTKIYNEQQRVKINRIRASMIATLSFFIENVYNRYIVLLSQ